MNYVSRSESGMDVYSPDPIWQKLREAVYNPGIDKNGILVKETFDKAKDDVNLSKDERYEHYRETRSHRLDRLAEEHF